MKTVIFQAISLMFILLACTPKASKKTNTITAYLEANVPHLDPIHSTSKYSSVINANIFEGLYHYHYLKRPITVQPKLADGLPQILNNGKTYIVKIKRNVHFHDDPAFPNNRGRELTAYDFIYSWKRLADPKLKALGWWVLDGLIEGLNDWRDKVRSGQANYETPVAGLTALDKYTLQIKLSRQSFQFLHYLSMPPTMVVAKEVVQKYGKEIINHPIGTGPYVLKKWQRNSEIILSKNPKYHKVLYPTIGEDQDKSKGLLKYAGQRLPLMNEVRVRIITEKQPLWLAFLKGDLDFGTIPKDNFEQVFQNNQLTKEFADKGLRIHSQKSPDVTIIAFNMEHPILGKNKSLRKALAAAIDKKTILEKFYNSRGIVAEGPIPPTIYGYDPEYKNPIQHDKTLAKQYLADAGYEGGKDLPVFNYEMANNSTWARQYGEVLKDQWAQLGVKIKLNVNTWPQFDKKIKTKKATIFDMAWMADYPDSQNFLQLFYSKNISPGPNNFNYINRKYDQIYEQAVVLPPGAERQALFKKLIDIINEDVPGVFIIHRLYRYPFHSWLENYKPYPIIYDYYQYLSVDEDKKAAHR